MVELFATQILCYLLSLLVQPSFDSENVDFLEQHAFCFPKVQVSQNFDVGEVVMDLDSRID